MNKRLVSIMMMLAVLVLIAAPARAKTKAEKQAEARQNAQQTMAKLYAARPSARAAIKAAAGYGAFSNFGMKILVAGGGKGQGIVVDNGTQKVTYMKMREIQAGLGMGVKKFRTIFVFETKAPWTTSSTMVGSSGGRQRRLRSQGVRVDRTRERCRSGRASGCISSLTRASRWKSRAKARSTSKMTI